MYPVSESFLQAVQENTRNYYWTGKITTKNGVVNKTFVSMLEKLGYDIVLTYVRRD